MRDRGGRTPLASVLAACSNAGIVTTLSVVELLLELGSVADEAMREQVRKIGESFEFFRERFNPDTLPATDAALTRLYAIFDVTPVPPLIRHDGHARIEVPPGPWQTQYAQLRKHLVPASGPAPTAQGEAIRICGRLSREILDNGGINW